MKLHLPRLALAMLLGGCASMGPQSANEPIRGSAAVPAQGAIAALQPVRAGWPVQDWWRSYGDPQLIALVERARANSPTLAAAQARVRAAAAIEGIAEAALRPQANLAARSTRTHFSANSNIPKPLAGNWAWFNDASLGLGYEVDFWGKNGAAVRAAAGRINAHPAFLFSRRITAASATFHHCGREVTTIHCRNAHFLPVS